MAVCGGSTVCHGAKLHVDGEIDEDGVLACDNGIVSEG